MCFTLFDALTVSDDLLLSINYAIFRLPSRLRLFGWAHALPLQRLLLTTWLFPFLFERVYLQIIWRHHYVSPKNVYSSSFEKIPPSEHWVLGLLLPSSCQSRLQSISHTFFYVVVLLQRSYFIDKTAFWIIFSGVLALQRQRDHL